MVKENEEAIEEITPETLELLNIYINANRLYNIKPVKIISVTKADKKTMDGKLLSMDNIYWKVSYTFNFTNISYIPAMLINADKFFIWVEEYMHRPFVYLTEPTQILHD